MTTFLRMVLLSMKRRKKEIRFVSLTTFIAVLCMSSISLFQNVMSRYITETNYKNYGEWVLSSVDKNLSHPYFARSGDCNTGAEIIDEKGTSSGEYLGSVDEDFLKLANLSFYEGRMPQKEDEIVMTLAALAKLGHHYELGQTIHVTVQQEEQVIEKDFTLVGTIKDFSRGWAYAEGHPLPSCIVLPSVLENVGNTQYITHFYQLERKYEDISMTEFCEPFLQKTTEKNPVTYNSYAYDNQMWGSEEMFQNVQRILVVIAVLVMSYLMMSYVTRRRQRYYQMRSTGAGKVQIWMMIIIEGAYGTIPWAFIALTLPYIVGFGICQYIAAKGELPSFFQMDWQNLILQVVVILGMIILVLLVACLSSGDKRLSSNVHEITNRQLKRLRRLTKKRRNVAVHFVKRQNRMRPLQQLVVIVFTIVVSGVLTLCINILHGKYQDYMRRVDGVYDFTASKILTSSMEYLKHEGGDGTYSYDSKDIYSGMDEQLEAQIEVLEGVQELKKGIEDTNHYLEWEGKENSPIFQAMYEDVVQYMNILEGEEDVLNGLIYMQFFYYDDFNQAQKKYGSLISGMQVDEAAFDKGEEIIVILREQVRVDYDNLDENGNPTEERIIETTLETGDYVTVKHKGNLAEVPAKVVVRTLTEKEEFAEFENITGNFADQYVIIASQNFMDKLVAASGKTVQYNQMFINFEPNSSFKSTTKRLALLLQENDFDYSPEWEWKEEARNIWIQNLCIYGTVLVVILAVYLILLMNLNQMKNYNRRKKYQILKQLGMSDSFFFKMAIKEGVKDARWLLPGIPLGYVLLFMVEWYAVQKERGSSTIEIFSTYLGEFTDSRFWYVMQEVHDEMTILPVIIFMILLMAAVISIGCLSARAAMKKEERI